MRDLVSRSSTMLILAGVVAALFGVLAMAWTVSTAIALVVLWGAFALVDGIVAIIGAFTKGAPGALRAFLIIVGLLGIVAGVIALTRPITSAVALTWVLGIWLIARGILEIVDGFAQHGNSRWWLVIGGVLWILAGILFAANPGTAALAVTFWLGLLALAWGIFSIVAGIMAKRRARELSEPASA